MNIQFDASDYFIAYSRQDLNDAINQDARDVALLMPDKYPCLFKQAGCIQGKIVFSYIYDFEIL